MPVLNTRGPRVAPARSSSPCANTILVSLLGSWVVVTPNARLARYGQLFCGIIPWPNAVPNCSPCHDAPLAGR